MQFQLDDERSLLENATRELLEKESPLAEARKLMEDSAEGFSKSLYARLAELGYLGLTLPESEGGSGLGAIGLSAVLHEMGRAAFPGPYLDLVLAVEMLGSAGGDPALRWRNRIAGGEALVVPALRESISGPEPERPETRFAGGRVRGAKRFVPFGASADALLVWTAEGLALTLRPSDGWDARAQPTLDHAQRFAEIRLDAPAELLADAALGREILARVERAAALGAAALLLGLMERSLELATDYMRERRTFGVPIGSFQALQHRAADMLLRVESSRAAVYRAAWAVDCDPARAPLLVAAAKAYCGEAARFVTGETIQIFGGVGFTWEYDPHIYFKRVKTLEEFYGSTRSQLEAALHAAGF